MNSRFCRKTQDRSMLLLVSGRHLLPSNISIKKLGKKTLIEDSTQRVEAGILRSAILDRTKNTSRYFSASAWLASFSFRARIVLFQKLETL